MTTQTGQQTDTTGNPAIAFVREGVQLGHWYLEGTMADVTPEQAHYTPDGRANPIGATYAHLVCSEDMIGTETGEISALKGIQGAKGYPF